LAVVSEIADNIAVMYRGDIVEQGSREQVLNHSQHSYTKNLLASIPSGEKLKTTEINENILLQVRGLKTYFSSQSGTIFNRQKQLNKAVNDVSFDIKRGEIIGLVGESGSGKSTIGRSILQLLPVTGGSVKFKGEELTQLNHKQLTAMRRQMQMIFQDPYASLNPRMTVLSLLAEPLLFHGLANKKNVKDQVLALMDDVGLAHNSLRKYPHEFSGGQRQRIAIARAIATKPELIIADEPVSALDVTIQTQILDLILSLVNKHNLTMLFISHDLSVVRSLCDRVIVMNHGKVVETGHTESLYAEPTHSYTKALLSAIPTMA
jgi:ABC-type oligopeptide transport system ATPase subunit